nr:MAG TPA: hypothetical protein [Caudoviricetes sp.]
MRVNRSWRTFNYILIPAGYSGGNLCFLFSEMRTFSTHFKPMLL